MIVFNSTLNAASKPFMFNVELLRDELAVRLDDAFRGLPTTSIWFVPGAQAEDEIKAIAPANWASDGYLDFDMPLSRVDESAINLAQTMIFHAPTVGTYSTWMIPGIDHPDFRRPE